MDNTTPLEVKRISFCFNIIFVEEDIVMGHGTRDMGQGGDQGHGTPGPGGTRDMRTGNLGGGLVTWDRRHWSPPHGMRAEY